MPHSAQSDAKLVATLPDRFSEVRRLGSGAEGGAFRAIDGDAGRNVVLKRVDAQNQTAVEHAFGVLRRVGSPHLPAVRALVRAADGATWLTSDWVEGAPLEPGPASTATAVGEALAVAHALCAIHDAGTHHGDVSPANVLVTPTRGVVLIDLGQLGRVGTGTPGFIAPEVLAGGGGPAADRFALGCLLCWRLTGQVPWQRPESLLRVANPRDVRARLQVLVADAAAGPAQLPGPLSTLLERLLAPEADARAPDTRTVVRRLAQLHAAAAAGVDLRSPTTWWPPTRWPYRGVDLGPTIERLRGEAPPRLVAVVGPPESGRGRVVEEVVAELQAGGGVAQLCDADRVGRAVGRPGAGWLEAWMEADDPTRPGDGPQRSAASAGSGVIGLPDPPRWPTGADDPTTRSAIVRAAVAAATRTLIFPVDGEVAEKLAEVGDVEVIELRPWTADELGAALATVVEAEDRPAWAAVLAGATGGWPARVVRAVAACARAGLESPDLPEVEAALQAEGGSGLGLDASVARAVLQLRWQPGASAAAAIPGHLHDGTAPRGVAVAAARHVLGDEVAPLARATAQACARNGERVGLALAIDAALPQEVDRCVADAPPGPNDAEATMLCRWLATAEAAGVQPGTRAFAAAQLLGRGEAEQALALCRDSTDPRCVIEAARARQRLGRSADALADLEAAGPFDDPDLQWRARGLRWRLLTDLNRGAEALADARDVATLGAGPGPGMDVGDPARQRSIGFALALLWAGFAALSTGDEAAAQSWLDRAAAAAEPHGGSEAAGVRARVSQLLGNLAHDTGDLPAAARAFGRAAESFALAGETVGGLLLRGSLAALAIPMADASTGAHHGRIAVRGLLARGQFHALSEAAQNLSQLLARLGAVEEAEALLTLVRDIFSGPGGPRDSALVRGRIERIDAELCAARLRVKTGGRGGPGDSDVRRDAEARFVRAARTLADSPREALDAWLRAGALARGGGRLGRARAHLARARDLLGVAGDDASRLGATLEAVELASAAGDPGAAQRELVALRTLPTVPALRASGRLELAWNYDRAVLRALRLQQPQGHPARKGAARRLLSTLESIMSKTSALDRNAVRASFVAESGEPTALRELLEELGDEAATGEPAAASAPGVGARAATGPAASASDLTAARLERLMRTYRRFAREERLEPLLEQVVDSVMDLTNAERGAVVVRRGDEHLEVTRELAAGSDGFKFSKSVISRVFDTGEPVLSVDAAHDDRFDGSRSISHLNLRSVLAVPLRFRGQLLGVAYVDHRLRRGNFDESHLELMEDFAELAAMAVAHAGALSEVRAQAQELERQGQELVGLLQEREAEVAGLREEVRTAAADERKAYRGIVGGTRAMQKVFRLIDRLAESEVPVVIYGESGTGKELVARAIHDAGPRGSGPFVAENCAAIPETLLESVLFGHAKGSFTGAQKDKSGLFEAAGGGTIFLDEVSEMSHAMQTKLLRVLQEGEVRRVGENTSRPVDVRVIAASNRDLDKVVEQGGFRRDLYYRINVVRMELPPLRLRQEDIPALAQHFISRHGEGRAFNISPAAMKLLSAYPWPGNVRELENEVQRWVALADGTIGPDDVSLALRGTATQAVDPDDLRIRPRVDRMERDLIARALERTNGNQTRAAELLGLSRYGLQKKLRRLAETEPQQ